jgi:type IV pilus assembly protein PilC
VADFRCRLATTTGEVIERDYTAADANALRRELERQDYLVLSVESRSGFTGALSGLLKRKKKVNMSEFLIFNQEFAALIRAGLPIVESLSLLIERRKNPVFRGALQDVRDRVKGGEALSDAFAAQEIFPALYASTMASGERSGEIATVLTRYIKYVQTLQGVRRKVMSALIYPVILITMASVVTLVLLTYVLPKFQDFFTGFGAELPLITRVVIGISNALRSYFLVWLAAVIGGTALFIVWRKTAAGQRAWERITYRIPLIGQVLKQFVVTRFSRTLGTLVAGGIPLVTCLEIVGRSIGTPLFADATNRVGAKVREGGSLWSSLEETHLFPDLMIEMTKVGESSGSLAEMQEYVADFLDQEIDTKLQRLIALVEPLLLVAMALIVGTLLLSIYYPMLMAYSSATGV